MRSIVLSSCAVFATVAATSVTPASAQISITHGGGNDKLALLDDGGDC